MSAYKRTVFLFLFIISSGCYSSERALAARKTADESFHELVYEDEFTSKDHFFGAKEEFKKILGVKNDQSYIMVSSKKIFMIPNDCKRRQLILNFLKSENKNNAAFIDKLTEFEKDSTKIWHDLELLCKYEAFAKDRLCTNGRCLNPAVYLCGRCKAGLYCSKKCQKKDWRVEHKAWCRGLRK